MSSSNGFISNEVATLVGHVELNRAGWWEATIQRLVLAVIWEAGEALKFEHIQRGMRDKYKRNIRESKLTSAIDCLINKDMLLKLPDGRFQLPLEKQKDFEEQIAASEKVEADAKELFDELLGALSVGIDIELCWQCFQDKFLRPLIKQVGVDAYNFMKGDDIHPDKKLLGDFVGSFAAEFHGSLRSLVVAFLDPKKPAVCSYMGRLLHAWFCIEASGLPEELIQKLNAGSKERPHFRMFVDTNFLFSLLDLHDNPANHAADELRDLLKIIDGHPKVELVVTPETIDEAKRSISHTISQLKGVPFTVNFVNAASNIGISGMAVRFLQQRYKQKGALSPDDWFEPYLESFVPTARSCGVELFNQKLDEYHMRQDVVDDIKQVDEYQKDQPPERQKSYRSIQHDMVLWHFVKDKRPAYVESPIDAREWILTVDFRFIGFDQYKHRSNGSIVPICIHPSSFMQLLQFWVPRTKEFEEAMLGSLPVLFDEFDAKAEATSLKILSGIGRSGSGILDHGLS